jgi:hypothetical protein
MGECGTPSPLDIGRPYRAGLGLATGVLPGTGNLALAAVPAGLAVVVIATVRSMVGASAVI